MDFFCRENLSPGGQVPQNAFYRSVALSDNGTTTVIGATLEENAGIPG